MDELYDEIGKRWRKKGGTFRTVVGITAQTLVMIYMYVSLLPQDPKEEPGTGREDVH